MDRDRDDNGVPDWQEDENYADEAPLRPPYRTRARSNSVGCVGALAVLGAGAAAVRLALRRG